MVSKLLIGALGALIVTEPGIAAERSFGIASFLRIRVEGPVTVEIVTGGSPKAHAVGDRDAIDRLRVESSGDQLLVAVDRVNWIGGAPANRGGQAVLYVTAPRLEALSVIGAGDVTVDRSSGARFGVVVTGSGRAAIDRLEVDQITVTINGTGSAKLAGTAKQGRIRSQGNGSVDGAALTLDDAETVLNGAGEIRLNVARTAHNVLNGSGRIVIEGNAACTGASEGSGEIMCGRAQ